MNDEDVAREALTIDAARSTIVLLIGMKGHGKSEAARMFFDSWPYDRIVIDPTGNAQPDDPTQVALAAPFPAGLPDPEQLDPPAERVTVWARIDPKSPTFTFDQDQAMGMALNPRHRPKLIWRDEFGLGVSPNTISGNDRAALYSSRHYHATLLLVTQRPRHIPTIAISQADKIIMFYLPNPKDREHIAENAGIPLPVLERQYHDNQRRHRHAYLLIDREQNAIVNCPPLPGVKARGPAA